MFCLLCGAILALTADHGMDTWEVMRSQHYGAMLAMGLFLLFMARGHLRQVAAAAMGRGKSDPPGMGPTALGGLIICAALAVGWLWWIRMPLWAAVVEVMVVYLVWLVISRIVAETGMLFFLQRMWAHNLFAVPSQGAVSTKIQVLTIGTIWPIFYSRETLMPFVVNALRLCWPTVQRAWRVLLVLLAASMMISIVVAGAVWLKLYYQDGAVQINTWFAMTWPASMLDMAHDYGRVPLLPGQSLHQVLIGAAIVIVLGLCRIRFARWPVVPIAFCMATTDSLGFMWLSVLIGWLCKVTVMRTGGMAGYERLRPAFIGLAIGELLMVGIWMIVGVIVRASGSDLSGYSILPGV